MPIGWTKDGAVDEQVSAALNAKVKAVRDALPKGESSPNCIRCGEEIPERRRKALKGVKHCVSCQSEIERGL